MIIPHYAGQIPYLTTEQMKEVDRLMIEEYGITLIQMMENAGRSLAILARWRFLDGDPQNRTVVILAGSGGNGGGALVCARHLSNFGANVSVFISRPIEGFKPVPGHQLEILQRMGVSIGQVAELETFPRQPELIIDGIIGYSLTGNPRGAAADMIHWANSQDAPILALDIPSGVDSTSGTVYDPAIKAAATLTLALPKQGLLASSGSEQVGELYLADISVPLALYRGIGLEIGRIFSLGEIVRLR